MATNAEVEAFIAEYALARKTIDRNIEGVTQNIIALIKELDGKLREIERAYKGKKEEPFMVEYLRKARLDINAAMERYTEEARKLTAAATEAAIQQGAAVTPAALGKIGMEAGIPSMSRFLLPTLTAMQRQVYDEMGDVLKRKVNHILTSSAAGIMPSSMAWRQIKDLLRTSEEFEDGRRRRTGIGYQAESIVRTEIGRAFANAQQMSAEALSKSIPGLRKRWITADTFEGGTAKKSAQGVRDGHKEAEENYAPGGNPGPIPIDERYVVRDYSRTGRTDFLTVGRPQRVIRVASYSRTGGIITDMMLFPRDPSGSPGNTINCRCVSIEVLPEIEEQQQEILSEE